MISSPILDKHTLTAPALGPRHGIRRIMACLPMSDRAPTLALQATALASRLNAELTFVHAGPQVRSRRQQLHEAFDRAGLPAPGTLVVQRGSPSRVLVETIEQRGVDLVIAGTLQWKSSLGRYSNSIAGKIIRSMQCPVWLISPSFAADSTLSTAVLSSPSDGASSNILEWYLPWSRELGLERVHIVEQSAASSSADTVSFGKVYIERRLPVCCEVHEGRPRLPGMVDGVELRPVTLANRTWCDALWYAEALGADVLCVALTPRQLAAWDRLLEHGIDPELDALPKSVLVYPTAEACYHPDVPRRMGVRAG